jgi:hypothetical protein
MNTIDIFTLPTTIHDNDSLLEDIINYNKSNKFNSVKNSFISSLLNKIKKNNIITNKLFDSNLIKLIMDYTPKLEYIATEEYPFIEEKIGDYQYYTSICYLKWNIRFVTNYYISRSYPRLSIVMNFTGFPNLRILDNKKPIYIPRPLMRTTNSVEQELRRDYDGQLVWINTFSDYYYQTDIVRFEEILEYL